MRRRTPFLPTWPLALGLIGAFGFGLGAVPVAASPIIQVGDHNLRADTPDQQIEVNVIGGDQVPGLNCYVQIADGGPEAGGSIDGPAITGLDILTGTIFNTSNTGAVDPESAGGYALPQWEGRTTTAAAAPVFASGLLATITIDTTGFQSGIFDLALDNTRNGPTNFAGLGAAITDGSIRVYLPGDINGDGAVNGLDVQPFVDLVLSHIYDVAADMNGDDEVNGLDVSPFVEAVLGSGTQSVPEPATAVLAMIGLATFLIRRHIAG